MFDTRIFNITDSKSLDDACQLLRQGELVAFPTETVYGLGANALDEQAVKKIFIAKGRPNDNPLIVHISSIEKIHPLISCADDDPSLQLALIIGKRFWPGPISLLFPKSKIVPDSVTGGLPSVVLRIPDHRIALQVLERLEFPLAAPSANTSGRPSPTTSQHVIDDLQGKISGIIEGGCSNVGVESTVLDLFSNPPLILRPGGITIDQLRDLIPNITYHPSIRIDHSDASIETNQQELDIKQLLNLMISRHEGKIQQQIQYQMSEQQIKHQSQPPSPASTPSSQIQIDNTTPAPPTPGMKYTHYAPDSPIALFINEYQYSNICQQQMKLSLNRIIETINEKKQDQEILKWNIVILLYSISKSSFSEYQSNELYNISYLQLGESLSSVQRNLFSILRDCDNIYKADIVLSESLNSQNEGVAIMNRLGKASKMVIRCWGQDILK